MAIRVSVVVPTYKRPQLLDRCLGALLAQDYEASALEIIVADDGDHRATREVVGRRQAQISAHGPRLQYVPVRGRHGPAAARNCGWRLARGSIIAFTDDDCIPEPDWVREGVAALGCDAAAVWGKTIMPVPADPTDYERDAARLQSSGFVTANCFCRRAALAAVGGLDESFTFAWREDSDLYFSLLERNLTVRHAPQAIVEHPIRPAPWGISIRQQRKILFDALLYKKHPRLYRSRIRATPPWHYYAVIGALAGTGLALGAGQSAVAVGAGATWALLTGGFCLSRLRDTRRSLRHVAEMIVTSVVIPPLAVFWRLVGAVRFRVLFL